VKVKSFIVRGKLLSVNRIENTLDPEELVTVAALVLSNLNKNPEILITALKGGCQQASYFPRRSKGYDSKKRLS
jgi:hypothetical protein